MIGWNGLVLNIVICFLSRDQIEHVNAGMYIFERHSGTVSELQSAEHLLCPRDVEHYYYEESFVAIPCAQRISQD